MGLCLQYLAREKNNLPLLNCLRALKFFVKSLVAFFAFDAFGVDLENPLKRRQSESEVPIVNVASGDNGEGLAQVLLDALVLRVQSQAGLEVGHGLLLLDEHNLPQLRPELRRELRELRR